jgi:hypothetical protein
VRAFCVTASVVLTAGALAAFLFILIADVGFAFLHSFRLFLGISLWALVAPLPVTLPLALVSGLIAALRAAVKDSRQSMTGSVA